MVAPPPSAPRTRAPSADPGSVRTTGQGGATVGSKVIRICTSFFSSSTTRSRVVAFSNETAAFEKSIVTPFTVTARLLDGAPTVPQVAAPPPPPPPPRPPPPPPPPVPPPPLPPPAPPPIP